jgi:hypothetical protein
MKKSALASCFILVATFLIASSASAQKFHHEGAKDAKVFVGCAARTVRSPRTSAAVAQARQIVNGRNVKTTNRRGDRQSPGLRT